VQLARIEFEQCFQSQRIFDVAQQAQHFLGDCHLDQRNTAHDLQRTSRRHL